MVDKTSRAVVLKPDKTSSLLVCGVQCFSCMLISNVHRSIIVMNSLDTRFSRNEEEGRNWDRVETGRKWYKKRAASERNKKTFTTLSHTKHKSAQMQEPPKHWKYRLSSDPLTIQQPHQPHPCTVHIPLPHNSLSLIPCQTTSILQ